MLSKCGLIYYHDGQNNHAYAMYASKWNGNTWLLISFLWFPVCSENSKKQHLIWIERNKHILIMVFIFLFCREKMFWKFNLMASSHVDTLLEKEAGSFIFQNYYKSWTSTLPHLWHIVIQTYPEDIILFWNVKWWVEFLYLKFRV